MAEGTLRIRVVGDASGFQRTMDRTASRLQRVGGRMRDVGMTATRRLSLPIAAAGAAVLTTAANFESSMNRVRAVSGATGDDFQRLEGLARELGSTTQFSAGQAADAMGFLAQAGFETEDMMSALPGTLDLAAAGQLELAQAADIASNVLTAFGMEASEIGRVNDTLAATASSANTNVEQMGEAFALVAPVAASSGMAIEETSAVLGVLGDAGIQASRAGTTMRGMLAALESPSVAAASAIEDLGLRTHDAEGALLPMADIVEQLEESGLSTANAMTIFGRRAGPGMAALVKEGSDRLRTLTGELEESGGTAERIADIQMEGLTGAIARFKSALEGAAIAIAESGLIDWAAGFAEKAAELFQGLSETNPAMLRAGVIVAGVAAAAGPLLVVLGLMVSALGAVLSPVGAVVAILATLTGAIATAYVKSETFREVVNNAFESVKNVVGPILGWFGDKIETLGGWLGNVAEWFGLTRTTVVDDVREMGNETVAEFTKMHQESKDQLLQLNTEGRSISTDLADKIIADSRRMKRETIAAHNEQYTENVATMQELARELDSISGSQATGVIADMTRQKQESVAAANEQQIQVAQKLRELSESGKIITDDMVNEILADMRRQRDGAITAVTQQENQITNILTRLEAESGRISVQMASTAITESARKRDKTITFAREEYRGRIDQINRLHRESDAFTTEMRDDAIADARRQRDETIAAARENHHGVVNEIKSMREGVLNEVDRMTGNTISGFQRMGRGMLSTLISSNVDIIAEVMSLQATIGGAIEWLVEVVGGGFGDMARRAIGKGREIVDWFRGLPQRIINAIGDLGGTVGGWIENQLGGIGNIVIDIAGRIGDGPGGFTGPGGGGPAAARAAQAAAGLPIVKTSGYRTPAQNRAAGGSPTSWHLDRSNPATDWAGPTWALDQFAARLRQMGGWRELLWRVPNHAPGDNPHVHVAHSGGTVTNRGIEPLRFDELLTKVQTGETIIPRGGEGAMHTVQRPQPVVINIDGREVARATIAHTRDQAARLQRQGEWL